MPRRGSKQNTKPVKTFHGKTYCSNEEDLRQVIINLMDAASKQGGGLVMKITKVEEEEKTEENNNN